jgi:hypothetical protein
MFQELTDELLDLQAVRASAGRALLGMTVDIGLCCSTTCCCCSSGGSSNK